jgi:hypothetical protein
MNYVGPTRPHPEFGHVIDRKGNVLDPPYKGEWDRRRPASAGKVFMGTCRPFGVPDPAPDEGPVNEYAANTVACPADVVGSPNIVRKEVAA